MKDKILISILEKVKIQGGEKHWEVGRGENKYRYYLGKDHRYRENNELKCKCIIKNAVLEIITLMKLLQNCFSF